MVVHGLILAALGLGHFCLVVLLVNVTHGLGVKDRWLAVFGRWIDRVTFALLVALGMATLALGWWMSGRSWRVWPHMLQAYAVVCLAVGLVGLPATTLARHRKRQRLGPTRQDEPIDLKRELGAEALIGDGSRAWLLRLPGNEALRLQLVELDLAIPELPSNFDGLSVVHLSDLHFAPCYRRRFFEEVADAAARWDADLVVFTGDLVDDDAAHDWVVPVLSRLRGRLGQFAILGNHDRFHDPARGADELRSAGFTFLDGTWDRLEAHGVAIAIGGTSAPWGPMLDPAAMPEADFRILLSHTPDQLYLASEWGIDLMLSGHNHGGQVRLPAFGPILMPSRYSRRFDEGIFHSGPTTLHVSRGIGAKHPIRYNCPPEVTKLVLRTKKSRPRTDPAFNDSELHDAART